MEKYKGDAEYEDDTAAIAKALAMPNLRILDLKNFVKDETVTAYKKKAIEIAIAQAKGELIVCTDADCRVGEDWLLAMKSLSLTVIDLACFIACLRVLQSMKIR